MGIYNYSKVKCYIIRIFSLPLHPQNKNNHALRVKFRNPLHQHLQYANQRVHVSERMKLSPDDCSKRVLKHHYDI